VVIKDNQQTRQPLCSSQRCKKSLEQPLFVKSKPESENQTSIDAKQSNLQPFYQVIKDTEKLDGLYTLYRPKRRVKSTWKSSSQLNKNYLGTVTLESGIGEREFIVACLCKISVLFPPRE